MTWIKLDDKAIDHPKVADLSDRAFRDWIRGLSYSSSFLTDGLLKASFVKKVPARIVAELIECNLWERIPTTGDILIHDYLDYQSSRATVHATRAQNAARVKRCRSGVTNARVTNPEIKEQSTDSKEQSHKHDDQLPPFDSPPPSSAFRPKPAFVGARLRVPFGLHDEFRKGLGTDGDSRLQQWYRLLDDELATTKADSGDVFKFLRPRYSHWATPAAPQARGAATTRVLQGSQADPDAVSQQLETRRRRAQMIDEGMAPKEVQVIFDREYVERRLKPLLDAGKTREQAKAELRAEGYPVDLVA